MKEPDFVSAQLLEEAKASVALDGETQSVQPPEPEKKHLVVPDYNPVETMLTKMEAWLIQQPEWAIILAAPRATRRQAIHLMSKRILTIPNRYGRF